MATTTADKAAVTFPEILTTKQAAEYLQLSADTIKSHAAAGMIPAAKVGRE